MTFFWSVQALSMMLFRVSVVVYKLSAPASLRVMAVTL
jgi:hypothetical protein